LLPLPLPLDLFLAIRRHLLAAILHVPTNSLRLSGEHADDLQRLHTVVDIHGHIPMVHGVAARLLLLGRHQLLKKLLTALLEALVLRQLMQQSDHD
jgi:hypothetical protein